MCAAGVGLRESPYISPAAGRNPAKIRMIWAQISKFPSVYLEYFCEISRKGYSPIVRGPAARGAWEEAVGSTSGLWRPLGPPPYHHLRPPFATMAASTTLAHAPGHPLDVSGAYSTLVFFPAPASSRPSPSLDRKSTRLNSSHSGESRMPSSA